MPDHRTPVQMNRRSRGCTTTRASDLNPEPIRWLWTGHFPLGDGDGEGGQGGRASAADQMFDLGGIATIDGILRKKPAIKLVIFDPASAFLDGSGNSRAERALLWRLKGDTRTGCPRDAQELAYLASAGYAESACGKEDTDDEYGMMMATGAKE